MDGFIETGSGGGIGFGLCEDIEHAVIAEPLGVFLVPLKEERVGDVSNVVFTNGAVARENREIYIYYASCDIRMHVAVTTIDKMEDYLFSTPKDPLRSPDCVKQRCELIRQNLALLR